MNQILSSAGYNGEGRLGRKGNTNQLNHITTELPQILMFSCGWKHNVFLTIDHRVFVCGDNSDGQLGPDIQQSLIPIESRRLSLLHPIWCSCGDKITALLSEDGHVYACGVGWGVGPVELTAPTEVIYISCGVILICGIGVNGEFYQWQNHSTTATQLASNVQFCDCAAGNFQAFALSTTGVLYATGRSKSCGQGRKWSSTELVPVTSLSGIVIKRIFAYSNHSVAIDEDGRVYVCGTNNYGQLGLGDVRKSNVFQLIPTFVDRPVLMASLGDTFTAFITENLELYTCGDGDEYRICNTIIGKVRVPTLADAALGKQVMWVSCGCSHIIIAENLEEFPQHLGRAHFGLEGSTRRKRRKLPTQMIPLDILKMNKGTLVDISDYGTIWTGYCHNDTVEIKDHGTCKVVGITLRGLVVSNEKGNILIDLKDLKNVFETVKITSRCNCQFEVLKSRSGFPLQVDTSPSSCQVFGFYPGDRVTHPLLGNATINGVFGGSLWFTFDDDEGCISTPLLSDVFYLHKWLKITQPANGRIIKYYHVDNERTIMNFNEDPKIDKDSSFYENINELPIEISPCNVLKTFGLEVGDLVESENGIGEIIGSFRHFAVIKELKSQNSSIVSVFPSSLLLLRREFNNDQQQVLIDRLALNGSAVSLDVSCSSSDPFKPFDRVITSRGHATLYGKKDGKWWIQTDDALVIGAGVGFINDESSFKLVRRISKEATINLKIQEEDFTISVSTLDFETTPVFPDDLILLNEKKYRVIGKDLKSQKIVLKTISDKEETYSFVSSESINKKYSIIFRADLLASRIYHSKTGNGLTLSVSMRDFIGQRFIPDDVIETPFGVGLVIGISDSNLGIHLNTEQGISFFTRQALYDASLFKLITRRAIVSMMNKR